MDDARAQTETNVVPIACARINRLLDRLGRLYEQRDAAEQRAAALANAIDETLVALDDARLEAAQTPLPVPVAAGGT